MPGLHFLLAQRYRQYYYLEVNKNTRNILNWVLIAMMVMLPLPNIMAVAQAGCEMHDQASQAAQDHSMHMMHLMDEDARIDAHESRNNDCCDRDMSCGRDISCTGDCGTATSVSFITQSAAMLPTLNRAVFNPLVDNNLVFRNLAPPVRPPSNLQI
jgi:hypothetical protein